MLPFSFQKNKGNALFLILIAVALFAALSYAVTQSGRGSGSISKERTDLAVAEMFQYAATIQNAVSRMLVLGRCTDTTISFDTPAWGRNDYYLAAAPVNNSCHVFHPDGGAVAYRTLPHAAAADGATIYIITGVLEVDGLGRTTGDSTGNELLLVARVSRDACTAINRRAGIITPDGDPPNFSPPVPDHGSFHVDGGYSFGYWLVDNQGSPYGSGTWDRLGDSGWGGTWPLLAGHTTGCYWQTVQDAYHFYHAVLVR